MLTWLGEIAIKSNSLWRISLVYGLGGALNRLLSLILLPVLTRYLNPADYGIFGLLSSFSAFLVPVASLGLGASLGVSYFAAKDQKERLLVVESAWRLSIIAAVLVFAIVFMGREAIARWVVSSEELANLVMFISLSAVLAVICQPLQLRLQFEQRPLAFILVSFIGAAGTLISTLWLVIVQGDGVRGLFLGLIVGQLIMLIGLLIAVPPQRLAKLPLNVIRTLVVHGIPLVPSFALVFLLQNGVRWQLESTHGMQEVGILSVGMSFGSALSIATSAVASAWLPWALSQRETWNAARYEVARRFTMFVTGAGAIVFLFFLFAQPVLWVLTERSFFPAWRVVGLSAATQLVLSIGSLVLIPVYLAKRVFTVTIAQAGGAVVSLVAGVYLSHLGSEGAALAVFIGSFVLLTLQLLINSMIRSVDPIPYQWRSLIGIVLSLLLLCSGTFLLDIHYPLVMSAYGLLGASFCLLMIFRSYLELEK